MVVELKIKKEIIDTKIIIETNRVSRDIQDILDYLNQCNEHTIDCYLDKVMYKIKYQDIYLVEAINQDVLVYTKKDQYKTKTRLYEIDNNFNKVGLLRISNSQIVNIKKVKSFDMSFKGTIIVTLKNNQICYASRRYVSKIKKYLKGEV